MTEINFKITLPAPADKFLKIMTDYENYEKFFEGYVNKIKILEKNDLETITEERFVFKSLFNHELIQKSIHKIIEKNTIQTNVIDGPFKDSLVEIHFQQTDSGTEITVKADYKIGLKYKIISPIIKQKYKTIIIGLLYKINSMALR